MQCYPYLDLRRFYLLTCRCGGFSGTKGGESCGTQCDSAIILDIICMMFGQKAKSEYATPIPKRTSPTDWPRTIAFSILFNFLIISTNVTQFISLFLFYPFEATRPYYERNVSYSKSVFSRLIVAISQLFGPTKLVVSCSDENGNALDPEQFAIRDEDGRVVKFNLPDRSIWMSNHQVRSICNP